jgi:Uma2 family endonuclease
MSVAIAEEKLDRDRLFDQQHIVLDDASWGLYEKVLEDIGDRAIRVTYHDGRMEIMAPLGEHEVGKKQIARLVELMSFELNIPMACYGSTTFRREEKRAGLEPDECYYVANEARVRGMKRYDPAIHPAPDLAIEVDITSRSVSREPVYAKLGVLEIWRYDGDTLSVLLLDVSGKYQPSPTSKSFPFLPMDKFTAFVRRMDDEDQLAVLREFQAWVRTLSRP